MKRWLMRSVVALAILFSGTALLAWLLWIPATREPPYPFVRTWGEPGEQPGQFRDPTGIAVTAEEVFVSDARNGRIQVFDHKGHFKRQFGRQGDERQRLGRPMNLSIHNAELYVADYWNDRIQVYGLDGTFRRRIGRSGSGPGEFNAPGGVAVAEDGSLYVADFYNQRIQHLRADGRFIEQWGTTGKVGIGAGEFPYRDVGEGREQDAVSFNYPTDVVLGKGGQLLVADGYNDRIQVFEPSGKFLRKWGGPFGMNIFGPFADWFATVTSVAVGPEGRVFVADFYNHRVQKFNAEGRFLTAFGGRGSGPGQFAYVAAVAVAPDGSVFATDLGNNRVLVFRPSGK